MYLSVFQNQLNVISLKLLDLQWYFLNQDGFVLNESLPFLEHKKIVSLFFKIL